MALRIKGSSGINFGGLALSIGLSGKKYSGYFADNVNWFDTATQTDSNITTEINDLDVSTPVSWQWLGYFNIGSLSSVNFQTSSDDASYVWAGSTAVNGYSTGNAIVDNGGSHGVQTRSGIFTPTSGDVLDGYTPIRIQFGNGAGLGSMTFRYDVGGGYVTDGIAYYFYDFNNELNDKFNSYWGI